MQMMVQVLYGGVLMEVAVLLNLTSLPMEWVMRRVGMLYIARHELAIIRLFQIQIIIFSSIHLLVYQEMQRLLKMNQTLMEK